MASYARLNHFIFRKDFCNCHLENNPRVDELLADMIKDAAAGRLTTTYIRCGACGTVLILAWPETFSVEDALFTQIRLSSEVK
jgi:hypothetical protein